MAIRRSPKTPPEAIPFQRGKRAPAHPSSKALTTWITSTTWNLLAAQDTTAHRLATSRDFWLERFGNDLLLSYKSEAARDALLGELDERCAAYGYRPERVFGKYLPQQAAERAAPVLLTGAQDKPLEIEVTEAGFKYGVDFAAGYSAGLFIDQRENRAHMRRLRPRRLLNTFAYTCSFSAAAALVGAETLSVDLSRRSLLRGEENFRRNDLDPKSGHRFLADDVLAVLPRLARRGETFDCIILDPPTFSRNHAGEAFQVQHDFERLVALALEVAAPRAHVLLSVNHSSMRIPDLERMARAALRLAGRSGQFTETPALPDFPAGEGAKTVWLEVR